MRGWLACQPPPPPSHKGDKLSHFEAEINCHIFYLHPLPISGLALTLNFKLTDFTVHLCGTSGWCRWNEWI